jgi:hypothetical protein
LAVARARIPLIDWATRFVAEDVGSIAAERQEFTDNVGVRRGVLFISSDSSKADSRLDASRILATGSPHIPFWRPNAWQDRCPSVLGYAGDLDGEPARREQRNRKQRSLGLLLALSRRKFEAEHVCSAPLFSDIDLLGCGERVINLDSSGSCSRPSYGPLADILTDDEYATSPRSKTFGSSTIIVRLSYLLLAVRLTQVGEASRQVRF